MNLIRLASIGLFGICLSLPSFGQQSTAVYPDIFGAYFNNMPLISPAYIPADVKMNLSLSYKTRTGALNKISTLNFAFTRVLNVNKPNNHMIRLYFYNEKDGPYIHKPRAYANYAYKIKLTEDTYVSTGIALGFAQTGFTAPSSTANGNSISPDGSLGLTFSHKKLDAGFAACQMFNSVVNPVVAPITYTRYYNSYINYTFKLSPFVDLKSGFLWRALPSYQDDVCLFGMLEYKELVSFGGCYNYEKSLSFVVSTNLRVGKESIFISLVYNTPFFTKLPAWTDSVEMNGAYNFY